MKMPPQIKSNNFDEVVPEFDAKYIDCDNLEEVYKVIATADYLEYKISTRPVMG